MALVSDIQLQDGSVKPPKLDTTQKFTVAGLTATTALAVGETVPLSTTGLVTVKSANDITNWIQTTNTNGNVSLYLSNDARPDWALKVAGTASDSFIIANSYGANNTEQYPALSIGTAGAVGVGKTGAGSILDIAYANSTTGGIQITETTNSVGLKATSESSSASVGTTTNHKLGLRVNATTHATLDTSGQLGIGTDSPGAKLDVRGSATFNEGGAAVDFRVEGDTETNLLFVDGSADRVGIGTATPASLLHVDDGDGGNTVACFNGTINASCYAGEKEGHIIQCNFNNFTQRGGLSFNIDDVGTVTDSAACDSTVVTINGANTCVCFFKCDGSNDDISLVGGSIGNALCNDTSPKLGGNLDVNNQCIINSNTDEGIRLVPNGAGRVIIDGLCWPAADGPAGYVLCTDGSGDLTWSPDGGSTWDVGSGVLFTNAGCKVGIGTSTPSDILTVFSCAATTNWGLNVCDPHPACAYGAQIKVTGACTGFPALNVVQNSDPLFRVDTGGVVGIGTSALGSTCNVKLDIYSAGATTSMILRSGNTTAAASAILGEGYRANGDCEQVLQIYGRNKNGGIDLGILEISAETKYCTGAIELKTFDGSSMTTKMKINSAGQVGISTASPAAPLHIIGGDGDPSAVHSGDAQLILENNGQTFLELATGTTHYSGITFSDDVATRGAVAYDHGTGLGGGADSLHFQTAGSLKAVITSAGNFGIGTLSPATLLHVQESTLSGFSPDSNTNLAVEENSTSMIEIAGTDSGILFSDASAWAGRLFYCHGNDYLYLATGQTNRAAIAAGFVGIGTVSNSGFGGSCQQVIINGAANARLEFGIGGSQLGGLYSTADYLALYTSGNDYLSFQTCGTERVRILSTGKVGIGTATPAGTLHVNGCLIMGGHVGIATTAPQYPLDVRTSSDHRFFVRDSSTSSGAEVQIQAGNDADNATTPLKLSASKFFFENGNVGIGTQPSSVWGTNFKVLELGPQANVYSQTAASTSNSFSFSLNAEYDDETNDRWEYITTGGYASNYYMYQGSHNWRVNSSAGTAGNEVTWNNAMKLTNGGSLGIGTTSPDNKLHIKSSGFNVAQFEGGIPTFFYADTAFWGYGDTESYSGNLWGGHKTNCFLNAYTVGCERLRINSGGNVGIGTATPRARLTVQDTNTTATTIGVDNGSGSATFDISALGSTYNAHGVSACTVWFYSPDDINIGGATSNENHVNFISNGALNMRIDGSTRNVGIGTVPLGSVFWEGSISSKLQVSTTGGDASITVIRNHSLYGPTLILARNGGTIGTNTLANAGESVGGINYQANDGSKYVQVATINATLGSVASASCMSGLLTFNTAPPSNGSPQERMRIHCDGRIAMGTTATCIARLTALTSTGGDYAFFGVTTLCDRGVLFMCNTNNQFNDTMFVPTSSRNASTGYDFTRFNANDGLVFRVQGNGATQGDGAYTTPAGDYSEFFESTTGIASERGRAVVLDGDKIRYYNSATDELDSIIGVTRPKEEGSTAGFIGNNAWSHWHGKYLTDDWGVYIYETTTVWTWSVETETGSETHTAYEKDELAKDPSWTPPEGAVSSSQSVRKLNPDYDESLDSGYQARDSRDEWWLIGLLGQVPVKAGEPVNPRWIKMKDISAAVEYYYIR